MTKLLITIDGPAGAGKTTLSKALAHRLGYIYVDTGALYRGVAWMASQKGYAADDDDALADICGNLTLAFEGKGDQVRLLANDTDITSLIRTPAISMLASAVSARPVVRQFLLDAQRRLGAAKAAVFEGRDMGTVVFPEADVKFFVTADLAARAKRRFAELKPDFGMTLDSVKEQMARRDTNDSTRALAPLKPAQDAHHIDTTDLTVDQVLARMLAHISAAN